MSSNVEACKPFKTEDLKLFNLNLNLFKQVLLTFSWQDYEKVGQKLPDNLGFSDCFFVLVNYFSV
jgi:hypothetical protein